MALMRWSPARYLLSIRDGMNPPVHRIFWPSQRRSGRLAGGRPGPLAAVVCGPRAPTIVRYAGEAGGPAHPDRGTGGAGRRGFLGGGELPGRRVGALCGAAPEVSPALGGDRLQRRGQRWAQVLYVPPQSPDLSPIERCWSTWLSSRNRETFHTTGATASLEMKGGWKGGPRLTAPLLP
jgi:hypothetical protein